MEKYLNETYSNLEERYTNFINNFWNCSKKTLTHLFIYTKRYLPLFNKMQSSMPNILIKSIFNEWNKNPLYLNYILRTFTKLNVINPTDVIQYYFSEQPISIYSYYNYYINSNQIWNSLIIIYGKMYSRYEKATDESKSR